MSSQNVHFSFVCRGNGRVYHLVALRESLAVRLQGGVAMPYRGYAERLRGGRLRVYGEFLLRAIRELWSYRRAAPGS
jgi:hypothetical protein